MQDVAFCRVMRVYTVHNKGDATCIQNTERNFVKSLKLAKQNRNKNIKKECRVLRSYKC